MNPQFGISAGGILPAMSAQAIAQEERKAAELSQTQPLIQSLAAHVRTKWSVARDAKEQTVEPRMFSAVRARRGEYDPDVLQKIKQQNGSEIYMMLTSNKCRAAASWMRDVMLGTGSDKPWTLAPSPSPELPEDVEAEMRDFATQQMSQVIMATGTALPQTQLRRYLNELRDEYRYAMYQEAKFKVSLMEDKMEDQLVEGGFVHAMDQFMDDITTFPCAFLKGPVVRRKPRMKWMTGAQSGHQLVVEDTIVLEWERVDPFMVYPSPSALGIEDGDLIERHKLRTTDLEALIGVEGYDDEVIRMVLEQYGQGGLQEWLNVDSTKADAEGRNSTHTMTNPDGRIDALQFWGVVSGKMLREWGLDDKEIPDESKQYNCEVWLIGSYVIKASLNYHPLGLKPYYKASYENVPGAFWGNSTYDLVRDCQDMCNSAARALSNNMGIASGPQAWVNVDRLPQGEEITNMFPWKLWQTTSDPMGASTPPVGFFQPTSNAQELMMVYEKFSVLADEYSGIPRYMTGGSPTGGAGRTASGMSMLMSNANKSMKQVVANIDNNVMTPLLERLYFYNMRYGTDDTLKGDVMVVARGASSIVAKESSQVRRNEFLAATANPIDMQIMGIDGRATLLRETVKQLDVNPDEVVPPREKLRVQAQVTQMIQSGMPPQQAQLPNEAGQQAAPQGQELMDGSPVTNNFSQAPQ